MKIWFLFLVTSAFVYNATYAQQSITGSREMKVKQNVTPRQKADEMLAKMNAACTLNTEQQERISKAYVDYYTKHDALKKQKNVLSKTTYDDHSDAMKKTRDAVVKATLTAAQYKMWTVAKEREKKAAIKDKQEE